MLKPDTPNERIQTRAQKDLKLAHQLVTRVMSKEKKVQKIYGGLCHKFPVLVRTCGLCQAVVFSESKAAGGDPLNIAHGLLLDHLSILLKKDGRADLLIAIRDGDAESYMLATRRILSAWIYFKRFAVSILKVESAQDEDKAEDAQEEE